MLAIQVHRRYTALTALIHGASEADDKVFLRSLVLLETKQKGSGSVDTCFEPCTCLCSEIDPPAILQTANRAESILSNLTHGICVHRRILGPQVTSSWDY